MRSALLCCCLVLLVSANASVYAGNGMLEETKQLAAVQDGSDTSWVTEKIGQFLPLDQQFIDENGRHIRLGELIDRPTIILPIYFYCPNICSRSLANLAIALGSMSARAGVDYRVIALSFNEEESYKDAAAAKVNYTKILPASFPVEDWNFLTGKAEAIKTVTDGLGFRFQRVDEATFIHPAALMVIDKNGRIIRYVYGSFLAGDVDLAVSAAAAGTPMMSVKRLLDICLTYDPQGKTSIFQLVKIVVLLVFFSALAVLYMYLRRKGRAAGGAKNEMTQDRI